MNVTYRETDHATEECVAVGGIACDRAILPKKSLKNQNLLWHSGQTECLVCQLVAQKVMVRGAQCRQ